MKEIKRIFRYLKSIIDYGLWYPRSEDFILTTYIDANWAQSVDDKKITSGGAFFLGERLASWLSKKQDLVSLSTT